METISIIIPAYNIERYLSRCLNSIQEQSHKALEIIVVDDGSTDRTGLIAEEYAAIDPRIKVLHQENAGVTKARFAGLAAATGEWFGFVDGDDLIEYNMYERLLANALKYEADISHCGYQMMFHKRIDYYYNTGRLVVQDGRAALMELLVGSSIEPGLCNKLFHKSLLHSLFHSNVEQAGLRINEDLLMNFYLFRDSGTVVFDDFCPYYYIVRENSAATSTRKPHHFSDPMRVGMQLACECSGDRELYALALRLWVQRLLPAANQQQFPEIAEEARQTLKNIHKTRDSEYLSRKQRLLVKLCAYHPRLYRWVRRGYEAVTRVNHKYDLE